MDCIDQRDHMVNGRLRKHAMTQVKDMPWAACCLVEHILGAAADFASVRQECERIEISLDCPVEPNRMPCISQTDSPIDPDHGRAAFCKQRQ